MYQFQIKENEAGQRFDKYLHKLLPKAPSSFFYKMLRKKNIVLNGKKAEGKEKLCPGDLVSLFLAEETFTGFQQGNEGLLNAYEQAYKRLKEIQILYENKHVLLANKPAGILSQKAKPEDLSLNEWMIGYLLHKKEATAGSLTTYKPSVCNRLDRNTSGIVICAKSLSGSQEMNHMIAERKIRKFYRLLVKGIISEERVIEGYLWKDEVKNKVFISKEASGEKDSYIQTRYYPVQVLSEMTLLEVELITGKTHQIRGHMASEGHPLLGDYKYGDKAFNHKYKDRYGISSQQLHAYRLEFPVLSEAFYDLSEKTVIAAEPESFQKILKREEIRKKIQA